MGLFGSSRKKYLDDLINGLPQDSPSQGPYETQPYADPRETQEEYDPRGQASAAPDHKGMSPLKAGLLGLIGGPGMAEVLGRRRANDQEQEALAQKQAAFQQAQSSAFDYLTRVAKLDPRAAQAMSMDPGVVAKFASDAYAPQKFDSGGGSRYDPATGQWTTAPRFDGDGNIYAPSTTQAGQQFQAPNLVQRGTKTIPVQQGGEVRTVDALTGMRPDRVGQQAAPQASSGPQPGAIEDGYRFRGGDPGDPSNWEKIGGPSGSPARAGFRY